MKRKLKLLENKIAKYLNKYPFIKDFLRIARHSIYKPKFKLKLNDGFEVLPVPSESNEQSFFGYYTNLNASNEGEFIYHTTLAHKNIPDSGEIAAINVFDKTQDKSIKVTDTRAWNWQQGAMLQWYDVTEKTIIFNDFDTKVNNYITRIYSLKERKDIQVLDKPYYTLSRKFDKAYSLNFDRLRKYRAEYGYNCKSSISLPEELNDGIWEIDTKSKETNLIVSLDQLRNLSETKVGELQWVNHIQLNPSETKFLFLNRWFISEHKFRSRLTLFDLETKQLKVVFESDNISHYDWYNDQEIVIWSEVGSEGQSYKLFNVETLKWSEVGAKYLHGDGHPSYSNNKEFILTDTYPDKARLSKLIVYHQGKDEYQEIGKFYQPLKFNDEIRCDLHPRWSGYANYITFDSAHSGKRELYLSDVNSILEKN